MGKKVTVGYKYLLGLHLGLWKGPIDSIKKISVDGRTAWTGNNIGDVPIELPFGAIELFGGDEREGGVSGKIDIDMGFPSQAVNDYLDAQISGDIPAYRGMTSAVFRQVYTGNNPYLKPWAFVGERIHTRQNGIPQWYDEKAEIPSVNSYADIAQGDYFVNCRTPDLEYYDNVNYNFLGNANRESVNAALLGATYENVNAPNPISITGANTSDLFVVRKTVVAEDNVEARAYVMGSFPVNPDVGVYPVEAVTNRFAVTTPNNVSSLYWPDTFTTTLAAYNYAINQPDVYLTGHTGYRLWTVDTIDVGGGLSGGRTGEGRWAIHIYKADIESSTCYTPFDCSDMNPAHIIRECLTDPDWGMGYSDSDIDDTAFQFAADALWLELLGLSVTWSREAPLIDFVTEILRHIDAVLYVSRETGKFTLKLIRDDYSLSDLITLNETNVMGVIDANRPAVGELVASVTVNYYDRATGEQGSVTKHNQSLHQIQLGGGSATTVSYPAVTSGPLAARLCMRDLISLSTPLLSCRVEVGRIAESLNVGDAFILDWPDESINSVVMRVQQMTLGDSEKQTINIEALEDVFSLPTPIAAGGNGQAGIWTDPSAAEVLPALPRTVTEVPYYELVRELGVAFVDGVLASDPDAGYLLAAGGRQGTETNAQIAVDAGAGYANAEVMDFCPVASPTEDVWYTDTSIYITNFRDLDLVEPGSIAQFGNELLRVDSVGEDSTGLFITVGRGVLDTTPARHQLVDEESIVFWGYDFSGSAVQYTASDDLDVVMRTSLGASVLPLASAPVDSIVMNSRLVRPYPPGDFRVDAIRYSEIAAIEWDGANLVTWKHRDRLAQTDDFLYDYTATDIGPEAGTEYLVRCDAILINESVIADFIEVNVGSATTYTFGSSNAAAPLNTAFVRIKIFALRDAYESWQAATITIPVPPVSSEEDLVLIQTITNAVAGEFDFDTIPSGYSRIIIKGRLRSSAANTSDAIFLFFNGDTTVANYQRQLSAAVNGAATVTEAANSTIGASTGATSPAGSYATVSIVIEGYDSAVYVKTALGNSESFYEVGQQWVGQSGVANPSMTAAITRLRFRTDNHPTDGLLGTLRLYGES